MENTTDKVSKPLIIKLKTTDKGNATKRKANTKSSKTKKRIIKLPPNLQHLEEKMSGVTSRNSFTQDYAFRISLDELDLCVKTCTGNSLTDSSKSIYDAEVKHFLQLFKHYELEGDPFPINVKNLKRYITYKAMSGFTATGFVGTLSKLKAYHIINQLTWISDAQYTHIMYHIRGLVRNFYTEPKQKKPLLLKLLIRCMDQWLNAHIIDQRFNQIDQLGLITAGFVAHDLLLRGIELMQLKWKHIVYIESSNCFAITIEKSKMRQWKPETLYLYPYSTKESSYSGFDLLKQMYDVVHKNKTSSEQFICLPHIKERTTAKLYLCEFFKLLLIQSGVANAEDFSPHSFRSGGATDLADQNCPELIIQRLGRWRSDAYKLYIRDNPGLSATQAALCFNSCVDEYVNSLLANAY